MKDNTRRTLVLLSKQYNKPVVPYFSTFNERKPQQYRNLTFPIEETPSSTLFLLIQK